MLLRPGYLKRLIAGATFGLYMAHLLYYLNPQIAINPGRLLLVTLLYGLICALLFGGILIVLRIARVRLFGRGGDGFKPHGFGFIAAAAFVSALVYWAHLYVFRIYLPPGAVRILSKATTILGATAFVLLIIWLFERTATRRISSALFALGCALIAVSAFFLYERREGYVSGAREVVVAHVAVAQTRPVIVVAVRDLPFDWIVTLRGEGRLEWFDQASESNYLTRIEPFRTMSSKALWASLATGKLPYGHGVTGRFSYRTPLNAPGERYLILPIGVGFRVWGLIPLVERISAPLPAGDSLPFWRIFERLGSPAAVVNWPESGVAAIGSSIAITGDYLATLDARGIAPQPLAAELAPEMTTAAASRPQQLEALPARVRLAVQARIAADERAKQSVLHLVRERELPLVAVALTSLSDLVRAVRVDENRLPDRTSREGIAIRAWIDELDRFLAELARAAPSATIVVVSPSAPRPPRIPNTPLALIRSLVVDDDPGSHDGLLLLAGDDFVSRDHPRPRQVVDVVPTLLFAAGLPVARDMDGSVATDAFAAEKLRNRTLSLIQTYEAERIIVQREGDGGEADHRASQRPDTSS